MLDRYGSISNVLLLHPLILLLHINYRDLFLSPVVNAVVFLSRLSIEMEGLVNGGVFKGAKRG